VARAILKGGGDYFLTVKGNHKMLREDRLFCSHGMWVEKRRCLQARVILFANRYS
jgi:hypothetical protein